MPASELKKLKIQYATAEITKMIYATKGLANYNFVYLI